MPMHKKSVNRDPPRKRTDGKGLLDLTLGPIPIDGDGNRGADPLGRSKEYSGCQSGAPLLASRTTAGNRRYQNRSILTAVAWTTIETSEPIKRRVLSDL